MKHEPNENSTVSLQILLCNMQHFIITDRPVGAHTHTQITLEMKTSDLKAMSSQHDEHQSGLTPFFTLQYINKNEELVSTHQWLQINLGIVNTNTYSTNKQTNKKNIGTACSWVVSKKNLKGETSKYAL